MWEEPRWPEWGLAWPLAHSTTDPSRPMIPFGQVASFLVAQVRKLNDSNGRRSQLCDGGLKTWLRRTHVDRDKTRDGLEAVSAPHVKRMEKRHLVGGGHPGFPSSLPPSCLVS